jgi:hypothetical protein
MATGQAEAMGLWYTMSVSGEGRVVGTEGEAFDFDLAAGTG